MIKLLLTLLLLVPNYPRADLTIGSTLESRKEIVCVPGYATKTRKVSASTKRKIYEAYGITPKQAHYQIDHFIPLQLGGSNSPDNLWPQKFQNPFGAWHKDRLEDVLHYRVCHGLMTLKKAQDEIKRDWIDAFKRYVRN